MREATEQAIAGLFALTFGIGAIALGASAIVPHVQQSQNAEPVDAVVLSSESITYTGAEGQTNYGVDVRYRYTYDGESYTSESVSPGDDHGMSASRADEIVESYPPNESVTAYVDPDAPDTSYLVEEATPWYYYVLPVVGLLLLVMGVNTFRQLLRGEDPAAVDV